MGVIPPPVPDKPRPPAASICLLIASVSMLLFVTAVVVVVLLGYRRLDAPPAEAAAARDRAAEIAAGQEAALEEARARAADALPDDFDYERTLRRWYRQRDEALHLFLRELLQYPEGFADSQWIVHADRAAQADDWPEPLDPGRHGLDALYEGAAAWLDADEPFQHLAAAVRHGLAWQVHDPVEDEYRDDEPYLDAAGQLGMMLALRGLAAARMGDRETAWEYVDLATGLSRQLLREPAPDSALEALTLPFRVDIVLWAMLDDAPLTAAEQSRFDAVTVFRADAEPLAQTLHFEAALAPGKREAQGLFPRAAQRVLFDRFWGIQSELVAILAEPPRDAVEPIRTAHRTLPVYAEESRHRLRRSLYLYRIHWQSRFCWELTETAAALKAWKDAHGVYPDSLEALADAGAIPAVPEDPVWGEPVRYTRLGEGFALYMLRVEDWYWLYDYWMDEVDPNDLDGPYGLDWEVVWRALR